ncbi:MAG: helicase RepA family protein [Halopseudomonas aestusnigri]
MSDYIPWEPIYTKDLLEMEKTMISSDELFKQARELGWIEDDLDFPQYAWWTPPADKALDTEYFSLINKIDWERAEACGYPLEEFTGLGKERDHRIYTLRQNILPHFPKTYLKRGVTLSSQKMFLPRELRSRKKPKELIKGFIPQGSLVMLCAPPEVGKSFLAVDLMCHLALGKDWNGLKAQKVASVWALGEGEGGVMQRMTAWCKHYAVDLADIQSPLIHPNPINILDAIKIDEFLDDLEKKGNPISGEYPDLPPFGLLVIDTLNRSFGDGDENSQKDMSLFVKGCDQIRQRTGATVMVVHHTGKDGSRGARGSSVLPGAIDVQINLSRKSNGGILRIECGKYKDGPHFEPMEFDFTPIDISQEVGEPASSVVLVPRIMPVKKLGTAFKPPEPTLADKVHGYIILNSPARYSDIVSGTAASDGSGPSKRSVERTIKELSDTGQILKTKKGYTVTPTD